MKNQKNFFLLFRLKVNYSTNYSLWVNPIRAGGGLNHPALFSDGYFSIRKGVWRSKISWLFLIHYELSEIQKKMFYHIDFGFSGRCRHNQSLPHSSNIQKPIKQKILTLIGWHWLQLSQHPVAVNKHGHTSRPFFLRPKECFLFQI